MVNYALSEFTFVKGSSCAMIQSSAPIVFDILADVHSQPQVTQRKMQEMAPDHHHKAGAHPLQESNGANLLLQAHLDGINPLQADHKTTNHHNHGNHNLNHQAGSRVLPIQSTKRLGTSSRIPAGKRTRMAASCPCSAAAATARWLESAN
jgi:hypothetical protein